MCSNSNLVSVFWFSQGVRHSLVIALPTMEILDKKTIVTFQVIFKDIYTKDEIVMSSEYRNSPCLKII